MTKILPYPRYCTEMTSDSPKALPVRTRYEHALEAVDTPGICLMRCALALSGLFVLLTRPAQGQIGTWAYGVLFCYAAYSAALYYRATLHSDAMQSKVTHWVDVAWYLALVSLTGGTTSEFFLFFFFAILVSSFRWGFGEGMRVAIASALLSMAVGLAVLPNYEQWRGVLQPIYLVVLGYLIARWGESEILLKRRLMLLRELNRLPNPRFGVEQAIGTILERLRVFYEADTCFALMRKPDLSCLMHLADGNATKPLLLSQAVPQEMSRILLALPSQCAAVYSARPRWSFHHRASWHVHCTDAAHPEPSAKFGEQAANMLDTQSFVSVPLQRNEGGRLYVTSNAQTFAASDMHFIRQLAAQLAPVIENIQLLDRIASEAAGDERQKISRDLHDSTIQPYVGLRIGLEALRRKVQAENPLAREIDDLCEMTQHGIGELRRYVADLKSPANQTQSDFLFREVWKQAERFKAFHGIEVEVNAAPDKDINDRLAAEVIQIVNEGLSNIKRHTTSRRATVNLRRHEDRYIAQIINHGVQSNTHAFVPRSITERAQHLGGKVDIKQWQDGTAVTVEIPL